MGTRPTDLERLYTLRELSEAGYGDRMTLTRYIHQGRLPALKVGNTFKVRRCDLVKIAVPVQPHLDREESA